jgi:hypothetical protein
MKVFVVGRWECHELTIEKAFTTKELAIEYIEDKIKNYENTDKKTIEEEDENNTYYYINRDLSMIIQRIDLV